MPDVLTVIDLNESVAIKIENQPGLLAVAISRLEVVNIVPAISMKAIFKQWSAEYESDLFTSHAQSEFLAILMCNSIALLDIQFMRLWQQTCTTGY